MESRKKIALTEIAVIGMIAVVSVIAYLFYRENQTPPKTPETEKASVEKKQNELPLRKSPLPEMDPVEIATLKRRKALDLKNAGNYKQAQSELEGAEKSDPYNPDIKSDLGLLEIMRGNVEQAESIFSDLRAKYPEKPEYQIGYAKALIAGYSGYTPLKLMQSAELICENVLQKNPHFADATVLLAEIKLAQGQPDHALALLGRTTPASGSPASAAHTLVTARANMKLGNFHKAESILTSSLTKNPGIFDFSLALCELYFLWGAPQKALSELKATEKNASEILPPQKFALQMHYIKTFERLGKQKEANRLIEELRILMPDSAKVFAAQAKHLIVKRLFIKAEELCRNAIKKNKDNVPALLLLGEILETQGDLFRATEHYDRALKASENTSVESAAKLADVLIKRGEVMAAREVIEKLAPPATYFKLFLRWVKSLELSGGFADALANYDVYLKSIGESGTVRLRRAELFEAQGKLENAKTAYEELAPTDPLSSQLGISRIAWKKSGENGMKFDEDYITLYPKAGLSIRRAAIKNAIRHGAFPCALYHINIILKDDPRDLTALEQRALIRSWQAQLARALSEFAISKTDALTYATTLRREFRPLLQTLALESDAPFANYYEAQWARIDDMYREMIAAKTAPDKAILVYASTFKKYFADQIISLGLNPQTPASSRLAYLASAEQDLRDILKQTSSAFKARMTLIKNLVAQAKYSAALALNRNGIAMFPEDLSFQCQVPLIFYESTKFAESFSEFKKLIAQFPSKATPHYMFGMRLLDQDKPDEALAELEKALAISPQNTDVLFGMVAVRERLSETKGDVQLTEALKILDQIKALAKKMPQTEVRAYAAQAAINQSRANYIQAIADLHLATNAYSADPGENYNRLTLKIADAMILAAKSDKKHAGMKKEALLIYKRITENMPQLYLTATQKINAALKP